MAKIDDLHGSGEEDGYRARFGLIVPGIIPKIEFGQEFPTAEALWPGLARVKLEWIDDQIEWVSLDAYGGQRQGLYTSLVRHMHGHDARSPHIRSYRAFALNQQASWILQLAGFVEIAPLVLEIPDIGPEDRMSQYIRWKDGEISEPDWHVDLYRNPPIPLHAE